MIPLNFTIVEGETFDWDGFTRDYLDEDNYTPKDLREKYGLTKGQYYNKMRRVRKDTGFIRSRCRVKKDMRYIRPKKTGRYYVIKDINKRSVYCGSYSDLETAQLVRDILIENNWDKKTIQACIDVYGNHCSRKIGGSPLRDEALKRFDEFKELYYNGENTIADIERKMGFTRHQYNVCRDKIKEFDPNDKKLVRHYD